MTVRNLMAGYTAYTDAQELAAMRGTHREALVTTTDTGLSTFVTCAAHDFSEPGIAPKTVTLTTVRQRRETV